MKIVDKLAAGIQGGFDTLKSGGRVVAEKSVHVGADKAALASVTGTGASVASALGGVGLTAAVSAGLSQMEYEHKKKDIKNLYREELASILGKSEKKVKDRDVDTLAKYNATLAEHMAKTKKERNLNIGTIFAATIVSLAMVAAMANVGMFAPLLAVGGGAAIGGMGVGSIVAFGAKAAAAILAYSFVKEPLQKIGDTLFGMNRKTNHERIAAIHRDHKAGKTITAERVFAVFVHANPEIDAFIETRYGKKFDDLNVADRQSLTEIIGGKLDVPKITDDINHGRVKATELAFTVEGMVSGVLPKPGDSPKHSVLMTIKEKLHDVGERLTGHHETSASTQSFVERVGKTSRGDMGYVTQLEDARARDTLATQQR